VSALSHTGVQNRAKLGLIFNFVRLSLVHPGKSGVEIVGTIRAGLT